MSDSSIFSLNKSFLRLILSLRVIILCPLSMLALFVFASCPMMDNRSLENRSDYKEYMEKTSQLLLLPPKS